jgi:hypothetical protein
VIRLDPHAAMMISPASSRLPAAPRRLPALCSAALLTLLAGCDGSPSDAAARECGEGAMRLDVGQAVDVPLDEMCDLRPADGARYALAFYDAQLATLAETRDEPYNGVEERTAFTVIEGDGTEAGGSFDAVPLPAPAAQSPDYRVLAGASPRTSIETGTAGPWREGETMELGAPICPQTCTSRVARVLDGWLVFAVEDATLGADAARAVAMFDAAAPLFRQHALPMLEQVLTPHRPVTSLAAGQLVVLFRGNVSGVAGLAYSRLALEGNTHVIQMELEEEYDEGTLLSVLVHEVAHTFQFEFASRDAPVPGAQNEFGRTRWGVEGGATLASLEALRRATGRAWDGNVDFRAAPGSVWEKRLFFQSSLAGGSLVSGYGASASLLDHLAARRTAAGDPHDVALREVLRGAMEGWYGHVEDAPSRQGMTNRMRARIPSWNPVDAVLTWTLAAGGDDLVTDPAYQHPAWLRVGDVGPETDMGWMPYRTLDGGSNRLLRFNRPGGSSGWLLLRDTGAGVRVRVGSIPSVRWRLLRIS